MWRVTSIGIHFSPFCSLRRNSHKIHSSLLFWNLIGKQLLMQFFFFFKWQRDLNWKQWDKALLCHVVNIIKILCHHNNPTNNSRKKRTRPFSFNKADAFVSLTTVLSRNQVQSIWLRKPVAMNTAILFHLFHPIPKPQEWALTLQIKH